MEDPLIASPVDRVPKTWDRNGSLDPIHPTSAA